MGERWTEIESKPLGVSVSVLIWMLNCGEIICFCVVRFCIWCWYFVRIVYYSTADTILDYWPTICTCLFHAIRSRLSVWCRLRWPNISVLYVANVGLKRAHRGKLYNFVFVVVVVIVVVGDLEASFIIVSANTKLDIKIDTTNDQ